MIENLSSKSDLREAQRLRRAVFSRGLPAQAGEQMAAHFMASIPLTEKDVVALYAPMGDEADCMPLARALGLRVKALCLPVISETGQLEFRSWTPDDVLVAGKFGIRIPDAARSLAVPDVVLLPLLGFDGRGHRLGYGGGYYDRSVESLRRQKKLLCVGFAYSVQEMALLPEDPHDQRLDWIVTEKEARAFS